MSCTVTTVPNSRVTGEVTPTGLKNGGRMTEVVLNAVTWTALPATALTSRNAIGVQNITAIDIKLNYDNTTVGYVGILVAAGNERMMDITDSIIIYAKSASGTPTVTVEEIS